MSSGRHHVYTWFGGSLIHLPYDVHIKLGIQQGDRVTFIVFMRGWMEIKIIFERVTDGEQNSAEWSRCVVLSVLLRLQT